MSQSETSFEKRRGVIDVEIRRGYSQFHVRKLGGAIDEARLKVLEALAGAGISLDFVKLASQGISFLVLEGAADQTIKVLTKEALDFDCHRESCIVSVHAVNMRDEEGMIAQIVRQAIQSNVAVDQIGDMHDRILMVVSSEDAETLSRQIKDSLTEMAHAN